MSETTKELWLRNPGTSDVSLSDLGVKVPAGKTVNVYRVNPYITVAQVEKSMESGALFKRLASKTLHVVQKQVNPVPPTLNQIKESDGTVQAKKTKTSVVIETASDESEEEGNFDFADYGISDLGPVTQTKQDDGAVVVNTKQDEDTEPDKGVELKPELESGMSQQSQVVMKTARESMVDPTGPHAEASKPSAERPFTVVKPPDPDPEPEAKTPTGNTVTKDETGAVVVDGEKKFRSIKGIRRSQVEGTDETDDDDTAIEFEETEFDTKVATKTEDGSIVMKLKEEEPEPEEKKVVTKKPRPSKEK